MTQKKSKRRLTFFRLLVCGTGVAATAVAAYALLTRTSPMPLMIVLGAIGLVLTSAGALTSDKTCERMAEAITRDYES
jgi:hypothetical protein